MSTNPFLLDLSEYKRDINPVGQYYQQAATFLSQMKGISFDQALEFVKTSIKSGQFKVENPTVEYFQRQENGDRVFKETSLNEYINDSLNKGEVIAPTMTTYTKPLEKESLLVNFVDDNVAIRSRAKKAEFAAEAAGDTSTQAFKKIEQTNAKLSNNALSGAHVSPSTPMYNKTAHSTLTSTCRSTSGYGNANNEKLLNGNRHYWSPDVVINNIVSIIGNTNYEQLRLTIHRYNLVYPSVENVMECITYSSNLYWTSPRRLNNIIALVNTLTPIQRAAFVYTGDLYHLMKFNNDVIKTFIYKLSRKITGECPDAFDKLLTFPEDNVILAHHICYSEMKSKGKAYAKIKDTPELATLTLTAENITTVINEYSDFIKTFMVTNNVPASLAYFPESIRRAALTSDTDSTIFTVQDWVIWFRDGLIMDEETIAVAATMIFLASQAIVHILAKMSANFGVNPKRLKQIAMKNEFFFTVFVPTNVAKHYFSTIAVQEGNVKKERETEIKGVHLKSSNSPKVITKQAKEMMESIMDTVVEGKKISILKYLKQIGDTQRNIEASILRGDQEFYRLGEIKPPSSYKNPESSPYNFYLLWTEVFASKYPGAVTVPYQAIKVATNLDSPSATKEWLDKIEDREFANRLIEWMKKNNKVVLPSLMIPLDMVKFHGLPKEIVPIVEVRKIIKDLTNIFNLLLETLGFYIPTGTLVSDFY
jgi:hypothetical protein